MAGIEVILDGRSWVIAEDRACVFRLGTLLALRRLGIACDQTLEREAETQASRAVRGERGYVGLRYRVRRVRAALRSGREAPRATRRRASSVVPASLVPACRASTRNLLAARVPGRTPLRAPFSSLAGPCLRGTTSAPPEPMMGSSRQALVGSRDPRSRLTCRCRRRPRFGLREGPQVGQSHREGTVSRGGRHGSGSSLETWLV